LLELRTPLRASWVRLLRALDGLLRDKQIRYLLSGGNAREILLVHVHGCAPGRVTTDLDFGVLVASFAAFEDLKAAMEATGSFKRVATVAQRMVYEVSDARVVVDLVPFGGVARADGTLAWPPDGSTTMQVLGFEQAAACALSLAVEPGLVVPIASPEGLVMLKFVAWDDNGMAREARDAVDFFTLLRDHHEVVGLNALYDDHAELMESYGYNDRLAGAHILGQRVSAQVSRQLRDLIDRHLEPAAREKLLVNMLRGQTLIDIEGAEALLAAFEAGFKS
jgi:predicted nucleotidyltransferase